VILSSFLNGLPPGWLQVCGCGVSAAVGKHNLRGQKLIGICETFSYSKEKRSFGSRRPRFARSEGYGLYLLVLTREEGHAVIAG
jgi:hypothetical protein